jgi:hypothetical protein
MFSAVYWHKTTRAETAMLKTIVLHFLNGHKQEARPAALDKILQFLRLNDDNRALNILRRWIKQEPEPDDGRTEEFAADLELRHRLVEMCDGLLDREKSSLYKNIFELRYRPKSKDQLIINRYKNLVDEATKALSSKLPIDDYEFLKLARQTFVSEFNKKSHFISGGTLPDISPLDVIVDIPPFGKDQVRNLFIHLADGPINILEASGLAESIADTFRYWARVLRIYLHPAIHTQVKEFLIANQDIQKHSLFVTPCEVMFQKLGAWLGTRLSQHTVEAMK